MATFHKLLFNHRDRTNEIITKYIDKYKNSGDAITVAIWNSFIIENARDVIADFTQSGADVFHQSIVSNIQLNREDFDAIREVNLDAAEKYQQELKELYEKIVIIH
jgi:hypothetical protein